MYVSGEQPMVGDIVIKGNGDEGEVLKIATNGVGGETATVRWTTPHQKVSGINSPFAPSIESTRSLSLVRRKAE
jgi:hypothetical protein